jgi:hypothetical protein
VNSSDSCHNVPPASHNGCIKLYNNAHKIAGKQLYKPFVS